SARVDTLAASPGGPTSVDSPSDLLSAFLPAANAFHRGSRSNGPNLYQISDAKAQTRTGISAIHRNFQITTRSRHGDSSPRRHGLIMRSDRTNSLSPFEYLGMYATQTVDSCDLNIGNRIPRLIYVNYSAFDRFALHLRLR